MCVPGILERMTGQALFGDMAISLSAMKHTSYGLIPYASGQIFRCPLGVGNGPSRQAAIGKKLSVDVAMANE